MRLSFLFVCMFLAVRAIAGEPMQVDGVAVSGDASAMPIADIRDAIAAYNKEHAKKLSALRVESKDEIHAYLEPRDLGYVTVRRTDFTQPDKSVRHGWDIYGQGLPEYSEALGCIRAAQQVYVFPVPTPLEPHRDGRRMRLLGAEARGRLIDLLGNKDHWFVGLNDLMYPDKEPQNVGFLFVNGKDMLVLFIVHGDVLAGSFDGEHVDGTLESKLKMEQALDAWKVKYAQPELGK